MSDELIIPIDKAFWPKGVLRGLTPLLRELGDKHGNLVIAAVPNKHIMVKGAADNIAKAKPGLLKLYEEHFPDAPIPEELAGKPAAKAAASPKQAPAAKSSPKMAAKSSPKSTPKAAPAASSPKTAPKAAPLVVKDLKLKPAGKPAPAAMYSPELLWQCVKKDSSFLRKSPTPNMPWMSACPNNLTGVNSYKFSGLTGARTLGLSDVKTGDKEKIMLSTSAKSRSKAARPDSMIVRTGIPKQTKKGLAALDKAIAGTFYRQDLLDLVKTKYQKIKTSFKKRTATVKSRRSPKN